MPLTFNTVLNALKSLQYHTVAPPPTPLTHLLLVEQVLAELQLADTLYQRRVCLNHLLVNTMTDTMRHLCRVNHLTIPSPEHTLREAKVHILSEAMLNNTELTVASWMYYRYVRVDLDLSTPVYCDLIGIEERTLRRYHRYGVERLTETLLYREGCVMDAHKRLRLFNALPIVKLPHLYGREVLYNRIENGLVTARPQHLQIIGVPGIGKTALIHEVVRRLIERDCLDHLLWIDTPGSTGIVHDKINALTAPMQLSDYLMRFRVLVVMDTISLLAKDQMDSLLHDLNAAQVIVINRDYRVLKHVLTTIAIPPIPEEAAKHYIQHINSAQYPGYEYELTDGQLHRLWQCVGGHPGRIQEAVMAIWEDFGQKA